jgi:hypothetical protein
MAYLVRFFQGRPHSIGHLVHKIDGVEGALCSQTPKPAVGNRTRSGEWERIEQLPPNTRICQICQRIKQKLDNPLPPRVERDLERLAQWDERAAALQRQKMLTYYREKQRKRH